MECGYHVHRFGSEHTIGLGSLISRANPSHHENGKLLRVLPDFVVDKQGQVEMIEVKYRKNGVFDYEKQFKRRYKMDYPFPEAYFVIVSPESIRVQKAKNMVSGEMGLVPISGHEAFGFDILVVEKYVELVNHFIPAESTKLA